MDDDSVKALDKDHKRAMFAIMMYLRLCFSHIFTSPQIDILALEHYIIDDLNCYEDLPGDMFEGLMGLHEELTPDAISEMALEMLAPEVIADLHINMDGIYWERHSQGLIVTSMWLREYFEAQASSWVFAHTEYRPSAPVGHVCMAMPLMMLVENCLKAHDIDAAERPCLCKVHEVQVAYLTCGHCVCYACFTELICEEYPVTCAICDTLNNRVIKVHF